MSRTSHRSRVRQLALIPFLVAMLGACGGGDDEGAPATTSQAAQQGAECVAADSSLMAPLGGGMKNLEHRLKNGQAVRSDDHDDIYFVSAEVYGPGVEEGATGTWATTSLGGAEAIWTVDPVSKQYSDLRDGTEVADLSTDDHGVAESRACVETAG